VHSQADLDAVAAQLNGRPRETLHWKNPTEKLNDPSRWRTDHLTPPPISQRICSSSVTDHSQFELEYPRANRNAASYRTPPPSPGECEQMTTRALIKDHPWSHEKTRAGTLALAVAAEAAAGPWRLRVLPEPLVRRREQLRERSVRLLVMDADDTPATPEELRSWTVTASVADVGEVPVVTASGPPGSLRLFLPFDEDSQHVVMEARDGALHATFAFTLEPAREWTIHLVHHSHLDIGYTDPQGTVLGEHVAFLDSLLDLTRATDSWPEDARFRWAVESLWSFEQWAAARPRGRVEEFMDRVRAGQIELTAMPYNLHTDTCSTDELHELLRSARQLMRQYGVQFAAAMQTDVPGTVAGLPDALAQIGVRYLSVAHNWAGRSVPQMNGGQHLPRLFRWRAPSGASVLVWMTDSPHGLAYMEGAVLGFDSSYEMVDDLLPAYLTSLSTRPYPFPPGMFGWHGPAVEDRAPYPWNVLHLRLQGRFADNAPPRLIMAETVQRWNETWEYPRLRLSTNTDFFEDAESRLADQIETFEGDWGDWWVEGVGSGARPQAMVRRAQASLPTGQSLYGMAAILHHKGGASSGNELSRAAQAGAGRVYQSVSLFNEHTWGASNPWTHGDSGVDSGEQQWHWKYAHALRGLDDADVFVDHASAALGSALPAATDADLTYWVVNTTAAARTAVASLFIPESRVPLDRALAVRDGRTETPLAYQAVPQTNPNHRNAGRFLRVAVPDVPPFGLVRLELSVQAQTADASPPDERAVDPLVLENEHLRVAVDLRRSCIASIVDKATGRELVDQEAVVGFNGYVYDTYTTAGGYNTHSGQTAVTEELELLGSRSLARPAVVLERIDDPVEQRLTYEYPADGVRWARTTLRLGRDAAHLEIDNRLDKPTTMTKESAYLAFPFALHEPVVQYEITGAMTGTGLEHVPGAPQHMRAVRSFVSLADAVGAVAWVTRDAPLVQPETIALPYAPFPDSTAPRQPGTIYSWVHNNIWDTNFPSQQGFETTFRYAIGVARAGERLPPSALALRTAYEVDQPLVAIPAEGPPSTDMPTEVSLLALDDNRIKVIAVLAQPPDEGLDEDAHATDLLVRLQSYATEPAPVTLTCGFELSQAWTATYLGDSTGEARVNGAQISMVMPRLGAIAVLLRLRG